MNNTNKPDIPDLIAGALGVSRGTAYDMMREALADQQEPSEVQMRVGKGYWAKVDRKTPAEQLEKAQQLMRDNPGVYQMRLLYTDPQAQPAREWVGLTKEDHAELWKNNASINSFINATEAKLKEKNT